MRKEKPPKSGGKSTKRWAFEVVGTRPKAKRGISMPSLNLAYLVRWLRERKRWTQDYLMEIAGVKINLSRLESFIHNPNADNTKSLLDALDVPLETFFCNYVDDFDAQTFELKQQILQFLDWFMFCPKFLTKAEELIIKMGKLDGFDSGINKQLLLSNQSKFNQLSGNAGNTLDSIKEALAITFDKFDPTSFRAETLVFYEPQLIHMLAVTYSELKKIEDALAILTRLEGGLFRLPMDDRSKETLHAPVLLDLAKILLNKGDYNNAIKLCEQGSTMSIKRNGGKHTPDFAVTMAMALKAAQQTRECEKLLESAFLSYSLMHNNNMANTVLDYTNSMGFKFETYGLENQPIYIPEIKTDCYDFVNGRSFGDFMYNVRERTGLSEQAFCEGICNKSTLNRIENDKSSDMFGNVFMLEALMQRSGRDINNYYETFPSFKDYDNKQLRDGLNILLARGHYKEAEEKLNELKTNDGFEKGLNKQFLLSAEAEIYGAKHGYDEKHNQMLRDALKITKPRFSENNLAKERLTYKEIVIINQIGINLCSTGNKFEGIPLFKNLKTSMDKFYTEDTEKMRMYPTVLSNYSKYLGNFGEWSSALEIANEGTKICTENLDLNMLSGFAVARAWQMNELKTPSAETIPIFAQAFHASGLVNKRGNQNAVVNYAGEKLGIDFN